MKTVGKRLTRQEIVIVCVLAVVGIFAVLYVVATAHERSADADARDAYYSLDADVRAQACLTFSERLFARQYGGLQPTTEGREIVIGLRKAESRRERREAAIAAASLLYCSDRRLPGDWEVIQPDYRKLFRGSLDEQIEHVRDAIR